MKETELRECPFCGNVAEIHERFHSIEEVAFKKTEIPKGAKYCYEKITPNKHIYVYKRRVFIPRCSDSSCVGRTTKVFFDRELAIDAWGRTATNEREPI